MFNLLINPRKSIEGHRIKGSGPNYVWLLFPTFLLPIAMWLFTLDINQNGFVFSDIFFSAGVVYFGTLFFAWLFAMMVNIFTGKMNYNASLTSFVRAEFVFSWWFFLFALFSLVGFDARYRVLLSVFFVPIIVVMTLSVLIRSLMRQYRIDLLLTIVLLFILFASFAAVKFSFLLMTNFKCTNGLSILSLFV